MSHSPVRSLPVIIYYYCANQPAGRSFHFPNVVNRQTERNPSGKQRLPVTVGRHAKITAYHPTNVAATCVYKTCVYVFRPKDIISRYIVVVSNYAVARRSAAIRRRHYRAVEDNGVVPPHRRRRLGFSVSIRYRANRMSVRSARNYWPRPVAERLLSKVKYDRWRTWTRISGGGEVNFLKRTTKQDTLETLTGYSRLTNTL